MSSRLSTVAKASQQQLESKKRQAEFGLANNAFGAAAGAYGTKAVWREQEKKHFPERAAARAARSAAKPDNRLTRTGKKAWSKIPERHQKRLAAVAVPAAIGTAVGSQLINAAMDAQSAQYFAREVKDLRAKESRMSKSDVQITDVYISERPRGTGHGRRIDTTEPVEKKQRRFDAEADRQRRLGTYEGAGYAGALGIPVGGVLMRRAMGADKKAREAERKALSAILGKYKTGGALVAGGAGAAALGLAANRRAASARNERWT